MAFDVSLAVFQAPMAGAQDSALAIAVCRAGGIGALPAATLAPDALRDEIAAIRRATSAPFNVNFFCHAVPTPDPEREAAWREALTPYYSELGVESVGSGQARRPFDHDAADALEPDPPPVLSFHFGLPPDDLLARVLEWGRVVIATATSVEEAQWLAARGVHGIVAQGIEAGGHRGHFLGGPSELTTMALVPKIVDAVRVPVIAAGGISDARGVRAALALGAVAAQVGTAYLLCPEARTSPVHREALRVGGATAVTNVFTGRPARGLVNRLVTELGPISPLAPAFPLAASAVAPLRAAAEERGSGAFSPLWSGQGGARQGIGAAELTLELAS